ncbi:MAG: radical SAM protein [bacterium]|nr:radical SAM protein [bacterium]
MKVLLVNPPVYDFALHDYWLKPYGLLRIASALKKEGIEFNFFDFLDRGHPFYKKLDLKTDEYGRGKFYYEEVKKPDVISFIPRKFKRYGLPTDIFLEETFSKEYDFVFITTGMTYWYLGVREVIDIARERWPMARIVVGGIAATLMHEFYLSLGADEVVLGDNWESFWSKNFYLNPLDELPYYEVYEDLNYAVLRINEGCPLRCTYCASFLLKPRFRTFDVSRLVGLVEELYFGKGVRDFVFYDDALLYNLDAGLLPFQDKLRERNLLGKIRFHTPNALHVRKINRETAILLKEMGFETIFLGVETINPDLLKKVGFKLSYKDFEEAVKNLKEAGFSGDKITAYIFLGLPGQSPEEVEENIKIISEFGIRISLSEFSPIPGTPLGNRVIEEFKLFDPLLTNNSVFPAIYYGLETVNRLKNLKNELQKKFLSTLH